MLIPSIMLRGTIAVALGLLGAAAGEQSNCVPVSTPPEVFANQDF